MDFAALGGYRRCGTEKRRCELPTYYRAEWRWVQIRMYQLAKRAFDIAVAILAAAVATPFAAILAFVLWWTQGAVLFRQLRPGRNGRPFVLYKFCTMSYARDEHGELLPDEQRLTRIGLFARSLSLD